MIASSKAKEDDREHYKVVFNDLKCDRLVVNGEKTWVLMKEIHFLGHKVSKDCVRMDPTKVDAILIHNYFFFSLFWKRGLLRSTKKP